MKSTPKSTSKSNKKQNSAAKSAEKKISLKDKLSQQMLSSMRKISGLSFDIHQNQINANQLNQNINKSDGVKVIKTMQQIEHKDSKIKQFVSKIQDKNKQKLAYLLTQLIQKDSITTANKILSCKVIAQIIKLEKINFKSKDKLENLFSRFNNNRLNSLLNISGKLQLLQS